MSKTAYQWSGSPPPKPGLYHTRRNESKYLTPRYWDGAGWFEIGWSKSRGGQPFKIKGRKDEVYLRKISASLSQIQWGSPYKVYEPKEVLAHLVKTGVLPENWADAYQDEMRAAKAAR